MSPPIPLCRSLGVAASVLLAVSLGGPACTRRDTAAAGPNAAASRLMPEPARVADVPRELRRKLAASPIAFFRFVNQAWTREVCSAFANDLNALPTARLHGDAHVEQYAVTADARGLDDFDDSATGPAVVDIVRFLGSLELTARERGWSDALPAIVDAFLDGYARALDDPAYLPSEPAVAARLRAAPVKSAEAFLSWADSLMQPIEPDDLQLLDAAWARVQTYAARTEPEFTRAFMARKRVGWLRLGIGSALARKILVRIEGPTPALEDDVVIEAKEVSSLKDVPCLSIPPSGEVFRVVEGLRQIGRLDHRLLVALPTFVRKRPDTRGWWLKAWERSYKELEVADLRSAEELREVAHDVGAQLGRTNLVESSGRIGAQKRLVESEAIAHLRQKIRQVSDDLTGALLVAWEQFRKG